MRHTLNKQWLNIIRSLSDEKYQIKYGHKRHGGFVKHRSISLPSNWDKIRTIIKERDIVCQDCGNKEWLGVHHKDLDKLNNSLDNLILLCWTCHRKKHHAKSKA